MIEDGGNPNRVPTQARWASFDCYGTLIDWESGIASELGRLWPREDMSTLVADFHGLEREVLNDGSLRYREALERSLRRLAELRRLPLPDSEATALAESVSAWPAFPEVPAALRALRDGGWNLAVLSNSDPEYFDASMAHLGVEVQLRVLASEIGSYKPAHRHWEEFRRLSGCAPARHVHVAASVFHDIAPCIDLGIPTVWVNRGRARDTVVRAADVDDLEGLPDVAERLCPRLGAPVADQYPRETHFSR